MSKRSTDIIPIIDGKKRARYPRISYSINPKISMKHSNHREVLRSLINDICKVELAGLRDYFRGHPVKKRKRIEAILEEVLDAFQQEALDDVPDKVSFQPEFSQVDKSVIDRLVLKLSELESYDRQLSDYQNDMTLLSQDLDVWMSEVPSRITELQANQPLISVCGIYESVIDYRY